MSKFIRNDEVRIRKEERGFSVFIPFRGAYWLNDTAMEILDLACSKENIKEIVESLKRKYADVDKETLQKDVKKMIFLFEAIGLIRPLQRDKK
jgi:hypothetical protein